MLNERVQSMFNDYKPMNEPTLTVEVSLQCDKLVGDLAKSLFNEMIRVAGPTGDRVLSELDVEDMRKYLCTLSWIRRTHTAQVSNQITKQYKRFIRTVACPTLWYQVLICIGEAIDSDYSIKFIPGTVISERDLLAPEAVLIISDLLFSLQNNGLSLVAGIPIDVKGDLSFMAMAHVDETTLSYRRTHPVYGFLASFFASKEISEALGTLVRIKYGYDSDYQTLITRVLTSSHGVD